VPTSLQFALSNPVNGMEEEFNRWYGTDHLLHGVLNPGVLAGQRFRRAQAPWPSGKHEYLMIWEFDDPDFALRELAAAKNTAAMPLSPAIDMTTVQPPTMWRRAKIRNVARIAGNTSRRGSIVLVLANASDGQDAQFEHSLVAGGGLVDLADLSGVLSAEFLTLADQQIRGNARKYRYALLIELVEEAAGVTSLEKVLTRLPHLDQARWLASLFQPMGDRMTTDQARLLAKTL
jgi:hypothetical protein